MQDKAQIKNLDEEYYINIRNTLVFREGSVRVDKDGNLLSLAVLSEGFYREFLKELMGWDLENANSEEQNAPGIDLIDKKQKIAVQVSVTCDHKKIQHSIDKFNPQSYDGWHFYFVPIKMDYPFFRKGFTLPAGMLFDEKKDILSISQIMNIIDKETDIDKKHAVSLLMDKYTKESGSLFELRKRLFARLNEVRKNHPSFRLLDEDGIDRNLFPHSGELIPAHGSYNGNIAPIWEHIKAEHKDGFRHIVIEGDGGIGKSVSLLSVTEDNELLADIPAIYIHMYDLVYSGSCLTLPNYLAHNADSIGIDELCCDGGKPKLMLMLDGLNEVEYEFQNEILRSINNWAAGHKGAQIIIASRPIPGNPLNRLLAGNTLHISLVGLSKNQVKERLNAWSVPMPDDGSSIWETLKLPLFLTLYAKTANLPNETLNGYPLDVRASIGQASLIWNYLQRELLRKDNASWPLKCAIACEFVAPYIAYKLAIKNRFELEHDEAEELVEEAINSINMNTLPFHLSKINKHRSHKRHFLPDEDWEAFVLDETGLFVASGESANGENADNDKYAFVHQNFRDCLAGLHLVNIAQAATGAFPDIWRNSVRQDVLKYSAELMDEKTAAKLWNLNKNEMQYKTGETKTATSTYIQLELNSMLLNKAPMLDFSGMDLRGISLTRFMGLGITRLDLFSKPELSSGSRFNKQTFQSAGHKGSVSGIAVMPNRRIVSVSRDNTLRIWNANTGECHRTIIGHTNWVRCALSLSDNRIISGSDDKTVCVWDGDTGELNKKLNGHSDWVRCLAKLSDGTIASGSYDCTIRIWDINAGICVNILDGHTDRVRCIVEITEGLLASGSQDGEIRIWDVNSGECINTIKGHSDCVRCIALLNNNQIVTGSYDETLRIWDPITGECLKTLTGHYGSVNCITVLPNGCIASGSDDKTIRIWDGISGNCIRILSDLESPAASLAAIAEGLIIAGLDNGVIRIWDTYTGEHVITFEEHHGCIRCLAPLNDDCIICCSADNTLRLWDLCMQKVTTINNVKLNNIQCLVTLSNGIIACGSDDNVIYIWDTNTGSLVKKLNGHSDSVRCMAALSNNHIISGARDNTLRIWDVNEGKCINVLEGHNNSVECVTILPNGNIVSGANDRKIIQWDKEALKPTIVMDCINEAPTAIASLQDGEIALGKTDGKIDIINISENTRRISLEGHTDAITCIISLPNGKIASGSYDNTILVWDPHTGECLHRFEITEVDVSGKDFSKAILSDELSALLRQNGAIISSKNKIPNDKVIPD